MLAAFDLGVLFTVVIVTIGIISHIISAFSESQAKKQGPPPPVPDGRPPISPSQAEQERMRRFFEALGIPQEDVMPPRQLPPPIPAAKVVQPHRKPKPVSETAGRSAPKASKTPKASQPTHRRPALGALDTEPEHAGMHALEPLRVDPVREMRTVTSRIAAGSEMPPEQRAPSAIELTREMLSSKQGLQKAFLLREILGKPRALDPLHER